MRTVRMLWIPQAVILWAVLLLLLASLSPGAAIPAVSNNVHSLVAPASQPKKPAPVLQSYSAFRHATVVQGVLVPSPIDAPPSQKTPPGAIDCRKVRCIALSFDDGPRNSSTAKILTILETKKATATFFVIGKEIAGRETLIQRMAADNFEIGNHSWSHGDMAKMKPSQIEAELARTQEEILAAGGPLPALFRPPYGSVDAKLVGRAGLQIALWDEDPEDWRQTNPKALTRKILHDARPGGIIDLHDIHDVTVKALPTVIDKLRAKHYNFVTVSQLLHSKPRPGNAPFYGYGDMHNLPE